MREEVSTPRADEPIDRARARSVTALCEAAPAFQDGVDLGAAALVRRVAEDATLSDRLLQLSCALRDSPVSIGEAPFERYLLSVLDDLADHRVGEVIAFGAGENGRSFARMARLARVRIRCFVDNDDARLGMTVEGAPIASLEEAATFADLPLVICSKAGCRTMLRQMASVIGFDERLVFSHLSSWRLQLEHDAALAAADTACRAVVREAIESRAPWATTFLLSNYRWFVRQWTAPVAAGDPTLAGSPFVYQTR